MTTENNTESVKPKDTGVSAGAGGLPLLHLSVSPHVRSGLSVPGVMLAVIIALTPAFISSVIFFGLSALLITVVCVGAAVATEYVANLILKRGQTIQDYSAIVTGMLVAFNLSPTVPLWMAVLGSVFAIAVAKMVFGGLGCNFINPALAGRAFLMASYPAQMTDFPPTNLGGMNGLADGLSTAASADAIDAISSATPLEAIKYAFADGIFAAADFAGALTSLLTGNVGGCIGETSAIALAIGGIFLIAVKAVDIRIPLAYFLTVFLLFWLANGTGEFFTADAFITPTFHILAGGLFLGAFFMATDPVTSPITPRGRLLFGLGCGVLTFVIRKYGGYPEGVSYSIILMNLMVPLIDRYTKPAVYGEVKKRD
ncbi:MAG: RnfABCDGE type electron transport complex subunit D [Chitinispirillales bacterium]|jgi:electron transport complex protein RnfD|nr:RnfABCDGE type electron transport complex subunit D [Chitinispirillales bacterium]